MRPFRADEAAYKRSIAIDASTIGDITVTVAVSANRSDELAILENIYAAPRDARSFRFETNHTI